MAKLLNNTRIYGTGTVDTQLLINGLLGAHSTNSGVLQLQGGAGIQGGVFVSGNVTATTFIGALSGTASLATDVAGGTAGQLHYQIGANDTGFAGPGTAGQVLTSGGTGAPTYVNTTTLYVGRALVADSATGGAATANNLSGGILGQIPYQSGPNTTLFIGTGTQGSLLQMGANTASFVTSSTVQVGFAANVLGGAAGSLHYQSAANATAMLNIGGNNSILVSNGSVPSWTTSPTIGGNVTIVGNLTVQGTTTQVDSTVTNISDPIITLGAGAGGAIPVTDDGKDRGIAFVWTGTQAGLNTNRTGFFGFDRSSLYFTFITSATITNEVATPAGGTTRGAIDANLAGGTAGQLVYQSAADTTAFAGPGTAGQVLTSNGTSGPVYVNTTTLYVGRALTADSASGTSNQANNLNGGILGQIPYQSGPNTTLFIGTGTQGSILQMGANTATFVTTANIYVSSAVNANTLRGGTAGQLVYQSGVGVTAFAGPGNAGELLVSAGTGAPTYTSTSSIYVGFSNSSNNVRGGILGQIPYQTAANTTAFIGTGTNGSILVMGANTATFVTTANIYVNSAVNAQTIFGGTAGQLHYQSGAGVTAFAGPGTAGQVLTSGGTGAPTYVNTTTLYVGRALVADSASGGSASVNTQLQTSSASYFLTFVDSNNAASTAESVYTTSSFSVNPATGLITGVNFHATSNSNGTNFRVGDDAWIGDVDTANTIRITGLQDSTQGFIIFGNSNTTALGRSGAGGLTYGGNLIVHAGNTSTTYVNRAVTADSASGNAGSATNLAGGILGQIPYQSAANTTLFIGTGTQGSILQMGANTATFVTTANIYVSSAVNANTLRGGTAGQLVYQSGVGVTAFAGPGTAGQVLTSGGTGAPTYVNTTTLYVGRALVADSATGGAGTANNIAGGALGQIPYQLAAGSTAFIGTGTNGSILVMGANTASFVATSTIYVNRATLADNDSGGAAGGLRYQTGANASTFLSIGTAGQILRVNAGATAPEWVNTSSLYAGASVSSQNLFGGTAGQLVYQSGAGVTAFAGPGTAGQVLTSGGTGAPTYVTTTTLYVGRALTADSVSGSVTTAVNIAGGILGQIPYQLAAGSTAFIGTGTNGSILQMGANTATFVTTANIFVNSAVNAINLFGGTAGQLHYQSAPGVTAFAGPGTAGQLLVSGGTSAPTYTNTGSIYVGFSNQSNNLLAGTAGQLVYQSAANTTAFAGPGTAGQVLTSGGTGAPTYVTTTTLYVGRATVADSVSGSVTTAANIAGGILGQIPYQLAAGSTAFIGTGTNGSILQMGANTATFVTTANIYVNRATLADNDSGGAAGGLRYQTGANASTFLSIGTAGQMLRVNAGATAPEWVGTSSVYVNSAVNAQTLFGGTAGQLVYQSGAGVTAFAGPGTAGQVLTSGGTGAPTYVTTTTLYVGRATVADSVSGSVTTAANIAGGILGQIPYQLAAGSTAFIGTGTQGSILQMGANTATFVTTANIYVSSAVNANTLRGGTAGQLVYQSGVGVTAFAGPGTAGQVLTSGGTGAPTYVTTTTLYVGRAVTADNATGGSGSVNTQLQTASANYFPTFVDSNNAAATAELVYTTSSFVINPATGNVGFGAASSGFRVESNLGSVNNNTTNFGFNSIADAGANVGYAGYNLSLNNSTANATGFVRLARTASTVYLGMEIQSQSRDGIRLLTGSASPAEVMRVDANGNVGINNIAPASKLQVTGDVRISGITTVTNTTDAVSTITGAFQVAGGVGIGGGTFIGGITTASNTTGVHSTITGALRVAGGVGIGGGLFVGGVTTVTNTTGVNSTITGAFRVAGGVGIGGGLVVGGVITATTLAVTSFANYPRMLNDVSPYADNVRSVFPLIIDQTAVTGLVDSKDLTVAVDGVYQAPFVRERGLPWITTVNGFRGFRVVTTGTSANFVVLYNPPDIGSQIVITQINISTSTQTRSYPYSAAMIGLGD